MIADTNSLVGFFFNSLVGSTGGDWVLLGILVFAVVTFALILAKARAATAVMVGVSVAFMFSVAIGLSSNPFMSLFLVVIVVAGFILFNGLRKWLTGQ